MKNRCVKNLTLGVVLAWTGLVGAAGIAAETETPTPPVGVGVSRERAKDVCTQEPKSQWLPEAEMRLLAEFRGYKIVTFKVANSSCYEVYGFKDGHIVEAYFHPVTSKLVRQNIAK